MSVIILQNRGVSDLSTWRFKNYNEVTVDTELYTIKSAVHEHL